MKIAYKKSVLNSNLTIGTAWLIIGLVNLLLNEKAHWFNYGYLVLAIAYLYLYFHQKHKKYIVIENRVLKINQYFGKKINLAEIKQIRKFAGDYILKTGQKEVTINTQIITPDSLALLDKELEKLEVEWS